MDRFESINSIFDEYEVEQCIGELVNTENSSNSILYSAKRLENKNHLNSYEQYENMYQSSLKNPDEFWKNMALELVSWETMFKQVYSGSLNDTNYQWFLEGKLNACYNCVDRWAQATPDKIAIIHEPDDSEACQKITFSELLIKVCQFANLLKSLGVCKGDVVCIYMPNSLELCYAMLACARIGAIHNVIFAGFSAGSLVDRITDSQSKILITCDQINRGGKVIKIKQIVEEALKCTDLIEKAILFQLSESTESIIDSESSPNSKFLLASEMEHQEKTCNIEFVDSEHLLFILYTSGSTGKPKGVAHCTGGYLVYVGCTIKYIFDLHPNDVFGCMADGGWITGHSYAIYGPLLLGVTTILFSSTPLYPNPGRYWHLVEKHKATQLYTAPTAIRSLIKHGDEYPNKYNLSSLRVIGTVGETINPEAWKWYHDTIGRGTATVVDTYWQTETGGITMTPIIGCTPTKPGSVIAPFFGIEPAITDAHGNELSGPCAKGLLCFKRHWPGTLRTVYLNKDRLLRTYISPTNGFFQTGDAAYRDNDGHYWICGRTDDVINVSGHRISSAELEFALVKHPLVVEAAVVGCPHEIKGNCIYCFVILKNSTPPHKAGDEIKKELVQTIRTAIGPIATPDYITIVENLPKTRSGKIVRRILRHLAAGNENFGDITTLSNAEVIQSIKSAILQ